MDSSRKVMGTVNIKNDLTGSVLKPIDLNKNDNNDKVQIFGKKATKTDEYLSADSESIENNLSNLSIKEEIYDLPNSKYLITGQQCNAFKSCHISRRHSNRSVVGGCFDFEEITDLEEDAGTGIRYFMENIDYMQEIECQIMPLGREFLQNCKKIDGSLRERAFCILLRLARKTNVEVYSASLGMMIIDRFMKFSESGMSRDKYKYYAVVSWYLACKYELLVYPSWEDVCFYAKLANTKLLRQYEIEILSIVDFSAYLPTPITFLRTLSIIDQVGGVSHNTSKLVLDVACQFYHLAGHTSNVLASAAYLLGMCIAHKSTDVVDIWRPSMQFLTGFSLDDLMPVLLELVEAVSNIMESESKVYCELKHAHRVIINNLESSLVDDLHKISDGIKNNKAIRKP